MAYTLWSVVYGEQPTAAKWNQLGANDAGFKDGTNIDNLAILNRHLAALAVTDAKIDHSTFNWANSRTGIVNTAVAGGFNYTALNGGLSVTFPAVNGAKYLVEINASFVSPSVNTQVDLKAQITGVAGDAIDTIATNANAGGIGVPHMGRTIFTATSTGNVTVNCGVSAGSACTVRTDQYVVSVRRIS